MGKQGGGRGAGAGAGLQHLAQAPLALALARRAGRRAADAGCGGTRGARQRAS
jgi:hypothetical protein